MTFEQVVQNAKEQDLTNESTNSGGESTKEDTMNKVALIIKREYSSRVKKKSFIIMTILGPLLIAAFYAAAIYIGIQQSDQVEVLLLDELLGPNI